MSESDKTALKEKNVCMRCRREVRAAAKKGATGWILQFSACHCEEPQMQSESQQDKTDADAADNNTEIPSLINNQYEVLEVLGKGGMGTVYKVRDNKLDRIFALKVLHQSLLRDITALKRFEQEAEAATKLDHPNLVSIYSHGKTESGEAYILMDYMEGETLAQVIEREGAIPEDRAISIFRQICSAIEHAHENNLIHRDIKPANIILSKSENGEETARIVDFGIAKTLPGADRETRDLTQTGEVFGSPHYMSPEQCLGFMLDERSDIYSFGCLMYETLNGKPPFAGSNPIQLVVKHINDPVKPFVSKYGKASKLKSLQAITLRCLEKQQIDRFQVMEEVTDCLNKVAAGKKISFAAEGRLKSSVLSKQVAPLSMIMPVLCMIFAAPLFMPEFRLDPKISSLLSLFICLGTFGLFAILFYEFGSLCYRLAREKRATKRHWWMTLSFFFSSLIFVGLIPSLGSPLFIIIGEPADSISHYWALVATSGFALSLFSVMASIVCSFGFIFDFGNAKLSIKSILLKALITASVFIACCFAIIPKQVAIVLGEIGIAVSDMHRLDRTKIGGSLLSFALILNPNNTRNIDNRARQCYVDKDYAQTLKDRSELITLYRARKDNTSLAQQYRYRGQTYEKLNEPQVAISDYTEEISVAPESTDGYLSRAECYKNLGQYDKALSDYNKAISLDPSHTGVYSDRADLFMRQGKFDDAMTDLTRRLQLQTGRSAFALVCRGFVHEQLKQVKEAHDDYTAALAAQKDDEIYLPYLAKALAYVQLGDTKAAKEQYAIAKTKKYFDSRYIEETLKWYPKQLQTKAKLFIPELQ